MAIKVCAAVSEPAEEQPEIVDRVRKAKKVVTITVAVEVPVQEAYVAKAAPGTCPVLRLDVDTLQIILHKLSARDLLQASAVSFPPGRHRVAQTPLFSCYQRSAALKLALQEKHQHLWGRGMTHLEAGLVIGGGAFEKPITGQ